MSIWRLSRKCADRLNEVRPVGSHHLMGTTRMHDDPKFGVVDAHCRVHGISNLFMAGSSTFPTGGYANPTLTIGAMALRLGDLRQHEFSAEALNCTLWNAAPCPAAAQSSVLTRPFTG